MQASLTTQQALEANKQAREELKVKALTVNPKDRRALGAIAKQKVALLKEAALLLAQAEKETAVA